MMRILVQKQRNKCRPCWENQNSLIVIRDSPTIMWLVSSISFLWFFIGISSTTGVTFLRISQKLYCLTRTTRTDLIVEISVATLSCRRPIRVKHRTINDRSDTSITTDKAKKYVRTENLGGEVYSTSVPFAFGIHEVRPTPWAIPSSAGKRLESASPKK